MNSTEGESSSTVRANLQQLIVVPPKKPSSRVWVKVSSVRSVALRVINCVLANPDMISKAVLAKRLDSQTAFEIVSIDIADIDVGANIGARLQADQAEADTQVARAAAESKRAAAVAEEQEMVAKIEQSRAKVVEAEAAVPRSIAEALQSGKLSIADYYKLQNISADTEMRKAISRSAKDTSSAASQRLA